MIKWLLAFWHRRQRKIDVDILWPACKQQALDLDQARAAFLTHAFNEDAWLALGDVEIVRVIGRLS